MTVYIIVPTIALIVNIVAWSYIFGQRQKNAVNHAFLLFATAVAGWLLIEFFYHIPVIKEHEIILLRIASIFWIPLGLLFLNFVYALCNKRRALFFYLSLAHAVIGILLNLFTNQFIKGVEHHPWGVNQINNPVRHTLLIAGMALSTFRGIELVVDKWRHTTNPVEKKVCVLILTGAGVAFGAAALLNVILPNFFKELTVPQYGNAAIEFFVVMVFLAVSKYRFLSISVEKVAEELFEDVQEGILLLDSSLRITRANRKARQLLGEDLTQRFATEFFSPSDLSGPLRKREVTIEGPWGEHILLLSSPLSGRSRRQSDRIILIRDVTAQKKAEAVLRKSRDELEAEVQQWTDQLRQAQKMEALGTIAGGIAHDFNNLLAAILGFTHAARNDLPLSHPIREDLGEVLSAGARAKEIIRQVLTFSRKEDRCEYHLMNIEEVIQEAIDLLRVSLPTTISIAKESYLKTTTARCDPAEIIQVVMNLGTNAFQAMGQQTSGELRFSMINHTIRDDYPDTTLPLDPGEYVVIKVQDTGEGMDAETMDRIFDPFFTTKAPGEGTGLGLSTALGIVKSHNGTISVASRKGEGSTFSVYLPALDEEPTEEARISEPASPGYERILLVDDEQQMRKVVRRMLEPLGYTVTIASDGLEGLEVFRSKPDDFDVIIADQTMPYMTGSELSRQVRKIDPKVPIILISAYLDDVSQTEMAENGISIFLRKPFTQGVLSERIRTALDGF